jgi:hypothetical protein
MDTEKIIQEYDDAIESVQAISDDLIIDDVPDEVQDVRTSSSFFPSSSFHFLLHRLLETTIIKLCLALVSLLSIGKRHISHSGPTLALWGSWKSPQRQ